MKLEVIQDIDRLYPHFESWWTARGVAAIPKQMLPLLGIAAMDGEQPVAAVWLYQDNSISLGFVTWFITRPGLSGRKAKQAIERMLEFLGQEAKRLGITCLIASSGAGALSRLIERSGYFVAGEPVTHHIKRL